MGVNRKKLSRLSSVTSIAAILREFLLQLHGDGQPCKTSA
jgi:hypothetical protein